MSIRISRNGETVWHSYRNEHKNMKLQKNMAFIWKVVWGLDIGNPNSSEFNSLSEQKTMEKKYR